MHAHIRFLARSALLFRLHALAVSSVNNLGVAHPKIILFSAIRQFVCVLTFSWQFLLRAQMLFSCWMLLLMLAL